MKYFKDNKMKKLIAVLICVSLPLGCGKQTKSAPAPKAVAIVKTSPSQGDVKKQDISEALVLDEDEAKENTFRGYVTSAGEFVRVHWVPIVALISTVILVSLGYKYDWLDRGRNQLKEVYDCLKDKCSDLKDKFKKKTDEKTDEEKKNNNEIETPKKDIEDGTGEKPKFEDSSKTSASSTSSKSRRKVTPPKKEGKKTPVKKEEKVEELALDEKTDSISIIVPEKKNSTTSSGSSSSEESSKKKDKGKPISPPPEPPPSTDPLASTIVGT